MFNEICYICDKKAKNWVYVTDGNYKTGSVEPRCEKHSKGMRNVS